MSAQPKPSEPSMEEILASIRRIIADDEVKPAEAAAPVAVPVALVPAPEPDSAADSEDDDVLDLGAEASRVDEVPAPVVEAVSLDDVDFAEAPEPAPAVEMAPPPVQMAVAPQPAPQPSLDMASLLSDQAGAAVNNAFGALAHTVLNNNARTLEDLVKDMLKPMLKTWLDDNLPGMVERLVRAEIERVARGGRH